MCSSWESSYSQRRGSSSKKQARNEEVFPRDLRECLPSYFGIYGMVLWKYEPRQYRLSNLIRLRILDGKLPIFHSSLCRYEHSPFAHRKLLRKLLRYSLCIRGTARAKYESTWFQSCDRCGSRMEFTPKVPKTSLPLSMRQEVT